jgi:hypothetical protein
MPLTFPNKIKNLATSKKSVASAKQAGMKKAASGTNVVLRFPTDLLQQVDQAVASRMPRIPRNTWLLEAVHAKLDTKDS